MSGTRTRCLALLAAVLVSLGGAVVAAPSAGNQILAGQCCHVL